MDKITSLNLRNPNTLARNLGGRLREMRLAKGWTQEELAERSGVAVSTLKLLETKGHGSIQRLIRVTISLGVDAELRNLFAQPATMESIDAIKSAERQRAPRRKRKGEADGA